VSTQTTIPSKHAGSNAAHSVLEAVPELENVPDTEAVHYDARTTTLLTPSEDVGFIGICLLEKGAPVEIKSTMAVYGEDQSPGRFYLRRQQHEALLSEAASYLFAVCEPRPERYVVSMKVVPASLVDELVYSWIEPDDRADYAQLSWTNLFSSEEVAR
jgi:hypothetical protein